MGETNTQFQDLETIFSALIRIGIVTAVDNGKRLARVKYPDLGYSSDWMPVLITRDFIPDYDVPQQTEPAAGGSGYAEYESHVHPLKIKPFMPVVNQQVLVVGEPVRNGRGYVLGGIQPWR